MHGFQKNLRSKVLLTRFALLLFHVAWTFYHHVCKHKSVRNIWFLHWVSFSLFLVVQHRWISNPWSKVSQNAPFHLMKFFLARTEKLRCSKLCYVKSNVVLLVDHFKILAGLISLEVLKNFSLEILKNAPVTSPTHDNALGGWYIHW